MALTALRGVLRIGTVDRKLEDMTVQIQALPAQALVRDTRLSGAAGVEIQTLCSGS